MRARARFLLAGLLVLGLISSGAMFFRRHPRGGGTKRSHAGQRQGEAGEEAAAGEAPVGTTDPASPAAAGIPGRRLDGAARARLAAALKAARTRRTGAGERPALETQSAPTRLDLANKTGHELSDWEQRQLGVLTELLGECYDLARAENPTLAGKVMLQFTVAAEPEIGGLVSEIRFDEAGTTIADPAMRECMTESLYALELEPPPEGVEASRQVTLDLSPDP